jgi:hypothetical protein
MNGKCELQGCSAAADGHWFAYWTVCDFMTMEACRKHSATMGLWLWQRSVDELPLQYLQWEGYETPSLPT